MNGRACFFEEKQRCLPVFIPLQKLNCFLLFWRRSFPLLGYLASSSVFHNSSLRNLTRNSTGAFILGLKNGWVKPIAWFGFYLQDFSRLLSWSFYTPKSCTLCGSHVQSQEDVIIVCNRFETKLKTTCLIPIYSCKKKFFFWPCRNFCPVLNPHCSSFHWSPSRIVPLNAFLKWNFSFHLTSSFVIALFLSLHV